MRHLFYFIITASISLTSCAPSYHLTQKVIQENNLTPEFLDHVQFYNTEDIVLTRYANGSKQSEAVKGTVTVKMGQEVEQIVIRANTPGKIIKHLDNGRIAVAFESDESKYLIFGQSGLTKDKVYYLQAKKWDNGRGVIEYGEHTYMTNQGVSDCGLSFKLKKNYDQQRNTRIAKGNKV